MIDYHDYLIGILADPEEAIAYLQASVEEYQKDGDTVAFLIALESIAEAQSENRELTFQVYSLSGRVHQLQKKYDWAIKDYNTAIALNPDNAETYTYRGMVYYYQRNYNPAIEDFTKAIELNLRVSSCLFSARCSLPITKRVRSGHCRLYRSIKTRAR